MHHEEIVSRRRWRGSGAEMRVSRQADCQGEESKMGREMKCFQGLELKILRRIHDVACLVATAGPTPSGPPE